MQYSDFDPGQRRILVCLDLVRQIDLPAEADPRSGEALRINNCRRILNYGRDLQWGVTHVLDHTVRGGRRARAIPGLEPLQIEPVHYRTGVSAFSNRRFRESLDEAPGVELVLLSLFLSPACLATALAARDRGFAVSLVEDVVDDTPDAAMGIGAIETLSHSLAAPFVKVLQTDDLVVMRERLHLVQGV